MQPILFPFVAIKNARGYRLGVSPSMQGAMPLPAIYLRIFGVTKDSSGTPLGGCLCLLFRTPDNVQVDSAVSDGSGNYEFRTAGLTTAYYVVAYKAGGPDLAGTTVNTLLGF